MKLLWINLSTVIAARLNFYITFTGSDILRDEIITRFGEGVLEDSFIIPIVNYKALT